MAVAALPGGHAGVVTAVETGPAGPLPPHPLEGSITFVGNATVLLRCAGFTVLTDPNFLHRGEHAWLGHGLVSRRLPEPALQLEELPALDAVVLSHLHGDHFDRRAKAGLAKDVPLVSTRHAERRLAPQGFTGVRGLRTWETTSLEKAGATMTVTSLPAAHARSPLVRALLPPVMGSLVEFRAQGASYRVWLSGDTVLVDGLRHIRERFPDVDLAVLHLGGTAPFTHVPGLRTVLVTLDGEGGAGAVELVRPRDTVPVHHSDYTVFTSPLSDFLAAVDRRRPPTRVHPLDPGETWPFAAGAAPLPG